MTERTGTFGARDLSDTRLTRTSAGSLTGERTEVTSARSRRLVGAAVRASRAWAATRTALSLAWTWVRRTVRPAGVLAVGDPARVERGLTDDDFDARHGPRGRARGTSRPMPRLT